MTIDTETFAGRLIKAVSERQRGAGYRMIGDMVTAIQQALGPGPEAVNIPRAIPRELGQPGKQNRR